MMKFGLQCVLLACTIFSILGCSSSSDRDPNTLVIGMDLTNRPFEMRDQQQQPDGISVRMAEDLGAYLDRPVKILPVAWEGIIPAIQSKKIDLIISSMTHTEERAQSIDFSDGYVTVSYTHLTLPTKA